MTSDNFNFPKSKNTQPLHDERAISLRKKVMHFSQENVRISGKNYGIGGHKNRGKNPAATPQMKHDSQRVVIKSRVVKMTSYAQKAMKMHLHYIERDGVEKDGSKGLLYGYDDNNIDRFKHTIDGEKHQFRLILSPENAQNLNLTEYTKAFIQSLEKDHDRQFEWCAVNHYNTDHPHVHIVIRGLDLQGQELRLNKEYMSHGMRERASDIATQWLGPRSQREIDKQLSHEIAQDRITSLDMKLSRYINNDMNVYQYELERLNKPLKISLMSRIKRLYTLDLVQKNHGFWSFKEDWKETLHDIGRQDAIYNQLFKKHGLSRHDVHIISENKPYQKGKINGIVVEKGVANELHDREYLVVKSDSQHYYFEQIFNVSQPIHKGHRVTISIDRFSYVKPSDRRILEIAQNNNGIYDPELHKKNIQSDTINISEDISISKDDFIAAHINRLEHLETLGFAHKKEHNQWSVDLNLHDKTQVLDQASKKKTNIYIKDHGMSREHSKSKNMEREIT